VLDGVDEALQHDVSSQTRASLLRWRAYRELPGSPAAAVRGRARSRAPENVVELGDRVER
jgi:hypothetical protein